MTKTTKVTLKETADLLDKKLPGGWSLDMTLWHWRPESTEIKWSVWSVTDKKTVMKADTLDAIHAWATQRNQDDLLVMASEAIDG